ncbi:MAG: protein kinase [bacterium]
MASANLVGADREAVAGVITVQLGLATPAEVEAARRRGALAETLQREGALSASQRAMIELMAADALAAHGGDVTLAAESVGGAGALVDLENAATAAPDGELAAVYDERVTITREQPGRYVAPGSEPSARELGRGGIGRVLVMHDAHLGRDVALKELLPGQRAGSTAGTQTLATTRFLREARITGRLEHPNIVPVYELGRRRDGTLYYTMKVVRGRTLADVLAEKRTLGERLTLLKHFADLCNAMAYAHDRGIIHRDLKPGNVMVGAFGETVLLDWGLAKPTGAADGPEVPAMATALDGSVDDMTATADGAVLGTPLYMSPEQARGEADIGPQADVWSLGVMLYELLTGQRPFGGKTPFAVLDQVTRGAFEPVRARCPEAPPELAAVVERALTVDRAARYPHAGALAAEIGAFLVGGRVRAYRYGLRELLGRFARRYKVALAVAGIAAVLLAGLGVVAYLQVRAERDRAMAAEQVARAARDDAEGLVQYMVGDLREKLEPLGRLDLLDGVVERVRAYLDRALPAGSDAMADEARARSRAATLYLVARLEAARARLGAAADAADEARTLRAALAARGGVDDAVALARSELQVAAIALSRGHRGQAETLTAAALARLVTVTAAEAPPIEAMRTRAEAHIALGELAATGGDLPAAERHFRDALVWQQRLVEAAPAENEWQDALAHGHDRLGNSRLDQGDLEGAERAFTEARQIRERLVAIHPDNLRWVRALGVSHDRIGDVQTERGDPAAAAASFGEAAKLLSRAAAQNPTHLGWRRDAAVGQLKVGDAAAHLDQREAALGAYEAAEAVLAALVEQEQTDIGWRRDLDVVRWRRADQLIALGRLDAAGQALDAALVDAEKITETVPGNALYRHDLAIGHFKRADLAARAGDATAAAVAYRTAAKQLARLAEDDPSNAAVRRDLEAARGRLAAVVRGGGVDPELLWSAVRRADATARVRPGASEGLMRGPGASPAVSPDAPGRGGAAAQPKIGAKEAATPAIRPAKPAIAPAEVAEEAPIAAPAIRPQSAAAPAAEPAIGFGGGADGGGAPADVPPAEALLDDPDLRPSGGAAAGEVSQPWLGASGDTRPRTLRRSPAPAIGPDDPAGPPPARARIAPDRAASPPIRFDGARDGVADPAIRTEAEKGAAPPAPARPRIAPEPNRARSPRPQVRPEAEDRKVNELE